MVNKIKTSATKRVCITGMGIVSPLGLERETTWSNIIAGKSGVDYIQQFDATNWTTSIAAEVKEFELDSNAVCNNHYDFVTRPVAFGLQAALEAMEDSGICNSVEQNRFGVSIGAGIGTISPHELALMLKGTSFDSAMSSLGRTTSNAHSSRLVMRNHPGTLAALVSAKWGLCGPLSTIHTACASSGQSIGQAYWQIRRGQADAMLAGGADSLSGELLLAGFCLLGALSKRNHEPQAASRPFDRGRDGFVAGEGAAILVLEEYEHAKARNAKIYAEITGYGETESAYRITDLPPDGRGIVEAMQIAIRDASLLPQDINYINAHGTSTELNDRVEALSIERVFDNHCQNGLKVSSTKSCIGHLISAAGALELAFCALAIRDNIVPPTINLDHNNCSAKIDFVAKKSQNITVNAAMSNSIGFGGSNSSLLLVKAN